MLETHRASKWQGLVIPCQHSSAGMFRALLEPKNLSGERGATALLKAETLTLLVCGCLLRC